MREVFPNSEYYYLKEIEGIYGILYDAIPKIVHRGEKNNPKNKKLAAIFDIDGTLIDHNKNAMPNINKIIKKLINRNVEIFILTARLTYCRIGTIEKLSEISNISLFNDAKYKDKKYLIMSDLDKSIDIWEFKQENIKKIKENYNLILTVGDNYSDIDEDYEVPRNIKLPNLKNYLVPG